MSRISSHESRIEQAVNDLKSFRRGDIGVAEAVGCGASAIPALRKVLFAHEPSGLFEPRCRAVEALQHLGAYEVLREFLSSHQDPTDPVERLGDDAVVNAAARALALAGERADFSLFLSLAEERLRPGVVAALGSYEQTEAIPYLVEALSEDECRLYAEKALARLGSEAIPDLVRVASAAVDNPSRERQRQSAHTLLAKITSGQAGLT